MWLAATDSYADLILNAVALEFVVNIDNMLYTSLLPPSVIEEIKNTKLWAERKSKTREERNKEKEQRALREHALSSACFFGALVFVFAYMTLGQSIPYIGIFPGWENDAQCPIYWGKITQRL